MAARYKRLSTRDDDGDGDPVQKWSRSDEDLRYSYDIPDRVPWKSVLLALFLLLAGTVLCTIAHLVFTSHLPGETSQAFGFLLLGILVFLPGFYETRIAYYSWRGRKGYKFSSIPAY